ncbi:hypothetical protein PQR62_07365 [Herbaspirillum lusitanum]|uniref:Uncharacterized protein n=1 Tax=Herbaspirillum lusitanum TaxID=213312 RepID=A0ABW9A6K2_9BURK
MIKINAANKYFSCAPGSASVRITTVRYSLALRCLIRDAARAPVKTRLAGAIGTRRDWLAEALDVHQHGLHV